MTEQEKSDLVLLTTRADAEKYVTDTLVEEVLGWFDDERGVPTEAFVDRLCDTYAVGWDIEDYDNEAARNILRRARKIKRGGA